MFKNGIEYEVIFETDNIEFPYEELDEKEKITVADEKMLIKNYASATNDEEARDALRNMWKLQLFCDFVIKSNIEKLYLVHQVIFCHFSPSLR